MSVKACDRCVEINGQPVIVHEWQLWLLVEDTDTGRQYRIDRCEICGDIDVSFTTSDTPEIQQLSRETYREIRVLPLLD
jgi:hypothetical protein